MPLPMTPSPWRRPVVLCAAVLVLGGCASPAPQSSVKLAVGQTDRGVLVWLPDNVLFEFGKAVLDPVRSAPYMDRVASLIKEKTTKSVSLEGHTDSVGSENANLTLSLARANAVRQALLERKVPEGRITTVGHGYSRPIAPNDTEAGRRLNRRVEILILEEKVDTLTKGEPPGLFEEAFGKLKSELGRLFQSQDKAAR